MRKWDLTNEAFSKLLAQLDPDSELAGMKYEEIRRKLKGFFLMKGCADPIELVDDTFDRVARKIDEGIKIEADDPYVYFRKVAEYIFSGHLRRVRLVALDDTSVDRHLRHDYDKKVRQAEEYSEREIKAQCLDECLNNLSVEKRGLVIQFMRGEKRTRIDNRRKMEEELGITANALSLRVFKIKGELKRCCDKCLKEIAGKG